MAKNDPVNRELLAIGADVGDPFNRVGDLKLTQDESHRYREVTGQLTYNRLAQVVRSPSWRDRSSDDKRNIVDTIKRQARAEARSQLFGASPGRSPAIDIPPPPLGAVIIQ